LALGFFSRREAPEVNESAPGLLMARWYSDWIEAYVALFDGRTEAPTRLHRWTAVSVLAGALTRRVWIDEITFRFYSNFYIVFVAPPGISTKSTAITLGINLLRELDHIYLAADNTTYPAFVRDLARRSTDLKETVEEDSRDDLWIRQCAITAALSELGTFFKVEDEDMVNGLTDLWDCRPIMVKDTKTSGTDIVEHPFVNLIAGTTPDWVRDKLKAQIGGWGLSSRIIFVYTDKKARRVARPSKLWAAGEFDSSTRKLVEDLRQIAELSGPFSFSPAADTFADSWYEQVSQQTEAHAAREEPDPWIGYFLARKQAHVHKLAMILSVARSDSLVIEEVDLRDAVAWVEEAEAEIPQIFALRLSPSPLARVERDLIARVVSDLSSAPGFALPRLDIFTRMNRFVDSSTATRMLDNAVGRGAFKQEVRQRVIYLKLPMMAGDE